jgi:hypothetical protein
MAVRVGIELSPFRCAIVDLDVPADRSRRGARIRGFRTIPWSLENTAAFVATLRILRTSRVVSTSAAVALWGVAGASHVLTRTPGHEADVEVRLRLAPLIAAGFAIERAMTVPDALAAMSRLLHPHAGDGVQAYLAVNADATALAIVRDGVLLAAREFPIVAGSAVLDPAAGEPAARSSRGEFAIRLGAELKRAFLQFTQQTSERVERVYVCGEFPSPRALTSPLVHILDVEVETLDSVEGLAPRAATVPDATVLGRASELRVAWAAGTDHASAANVLPLDLVARRAATHLARRSIAAMAAGCVLVAGAYGLARGWESRVDAGMAPLRHEIAVLEPQVRDAERAGLGRSIDAARASALASAAVHGPRLARVLEVFGRSAPRGVELESARFVSQGDRWRLAIAGKASASTPADAQTTFNDFLRLVAASPLIGPPLDGPSISIASAAAESRSALLHFGVVYEVRR